jgi:beta-lactamase regulating signal transducer with metallopeptidase domain
MIAFLLNAAMSTTLVALIALAVERLLPAGAAARHRLLVACLFVALLLPFLALSPRVPGRVVVVPVAPVAHDQANPILIAYFAIVAIAALRLVVRLIRAALLLREGDGPVRISSRVSAPITIGRTILIPSFLTENETLMRAALAHESAHVRRRDYALQLLIELLSLPLAIHPAVIAMKRRIALLREIACDELAAGEDRRDYAKALLAIASTAASPTFALGMGDDLERRIIALTTSRKARRCGILTLAIPIALFAAGCRYSVQPESAAILGQWVLDRAESRFGAIEHYTSFTQTIEQQGEHVIVRQERRWHHALRRCRWDIIPDGRNRQIPGMPPEARGTARWNQQKLLLDLRVGGHYEYSAAYVTEGGRKLICEGTIKGSQRSGPFRMVFTRP